MKLLFDRQLKRIINDCANGNHKAQEKLYGLYSSMLFGVCLRYMKNVPDAEDVLQESFMRIFRGINTYKGNGSFEGWMKTTCVRTALRALESKQKLSNHVSLLEEEIAVSESISVLHKLSADEIMDLVFNLPQGYRLVFNLYAIEGYKHHEIADMLNISEGTSKSQLARARQLLQKQLATLQNNNRENQFNVG